mgnify:CR=1 FL=1
MQATRDKLLTSTDKGTVSSPSAMSGENDDDISKLIWMDQCKQHPLAAFDPNSDTKAAKEISVTMTFETADVVNLNEIRSGDNVVKHGKLSPAGTRFSDAAITKHHEIPLRSDVSETNKQAGFRNPTPSRPNTENRKPQDLLGCPKSPTDGRRHAGRHPTLRASQNIPNVFFQTLRSDNSQEFWPTSDAVSELKGDRYIDESSQINSAGQHSSNLAIGLGQSSKGLNDHQRDSHVSMLDTCLTNELSCRSASSSPRVDRRARQMADPGVVAFSLNVPATPARKLSLQLLNQGRHLGIDRQNNDSNLRKQQQTTLNSPIDQYNNDSGNNMTNSNSLLVSSQNLMPRKSVIGRLERSSFQTQRLSDVGVAFGQQITAKMGLKLPASQERIVEQTRWLYLRYIFMKLRQNALPLRDLNLTKSSRARRAAALGEPSRLPSSAPASAPAIVSEYSITIDHSSGARRRTAMSQDLSLQDTSTLAARVRALGSKMDEQTISSANAHNSNYTSYSNDISSSAINCSSSNRKYIMDPTINNQIFTVILNIIRELRDMKPEFYGDTIYELIGIDKFSSLQNLLHVQMTICQEMTRTEISWCRIVALFSLFGAISLDCVRLGAPEHVGPILDGFIEFVERDLALWISQQGGWESFLYKHKAGSRLGQLTPKMIAISLLPLVAWTLVSLFK